MSNNNINIYVNVILENKMGVFIFSLNVKWLSLFFLDIFF